MKIFIAEMQIGFFSVKRDADSKTTCRLEKTFHLME